MLRFHIVVLLPLSASVMSNLRYIVMLGPEAKAKTIKIGLEVKAWPRGLHHSDEKKEKERRKEPISGFTA